VDWTAPGRRTFEQRRRLKRWWVPFIVVTLLVVDAATLTSGSIIGSVLWPPMDRRRAVIVWNMPAYREGIAATLRGQRGAMPIALAEYRQDGLRRPIWAPTIFSSGAITVTPAPGERLTGREVSQIATEIRSVIARRLGASAYSIPVRSGRHPIDARGVLGLMHNVVTLVVVWAGLYAPPALCRAVRRTMDRVNQAVVPKTEAEKRQEKLRKGECPGCRYDVRGLVEHQCPECGRRWMADEHGLIPAHDRSDADRVALPDS
jgi:hypothetical protein